MIWIYLCVLAVLLSAPFALSWYYTGKKKRKILDVPHDSSDIPLLHIASDDMNPENAEMHEELVAPAESVFEKPLYVKGNASFGERCELLESTECGGNMDVADGGAFFDLFARKISFLGGASETDFDSRIRECLKASKKTDEVVRNIRRVDDQEIVEKTIVTRHGLHVGKNAVIKGDILSVIGVELDEGSSVVGNIISHRALSVGKKCNILGDVSTEKDIDLEDNAMVLGNVISQENIRIGSGCHVSGNVFAQESVEMKKDVTVGTEGQIKSVVAGDTVVIRGNSTVYGRVRAIRGGKLLQEQILKDNEHRAGI